jgi:hypothetical protein
VCIAYVALFSVLSLVCVVVACLAPSQPLLARPVEFDLYQEWIIYFLGWVDSIISLPLSLILEVVTTTISTITTFTWLSFMHKYLTPGKPVSVPTRRRCHTVVKNYECGCPVYDWRGDALTAAAPEDPFDARADTMEDKLAHVEPVEVVGCCSKSCCAAEIGELEDIYNTLIETSTSFDIPNRHEDIEHAKQIANEAREWHLQNSSYIADNTAG